MNLVLVLILRLRLRLMVIRITWIGGIVVLIVFVAGRISIWLEGSGGW